MAAHHATRSATAALRADRAMVADQVLDPDEDTEHARRAEHEIIAMAPSSTSHSPREVNKRSPSVGRRTGSMPRRSSFRTPEVTDDDSYTRRRVSTAPARPTKSMQQSAQARAPLSEERKSLLCDNLERMTQIERELRDEKQAIARELELQRLERYLCRLPSARAPGDGARAHSACRACWTSAKVPPATWLVLSGGS